MYNKNDTSVVIGGKVFSGFSDDIKITIEREQVPKFWYKHVEGNRIEFITKEGDLCSVEVSTQLKEQLDKMTPTEVSPFSVTTK